MRLSLCPRAQFFCPLLEPREQPESERSLERKTERSDTQPIHLFPNMHTHTQKLHRIKRSVIEATVCSLWKHSNCIRSRVCCEDTNWVRRRKTNPEIFDYVTNAYFTLLIWTILFCFVVEVSRFFIEQTRYYYRSLYDELFNRQYKFLIWQNCEIRYYRLLVLKKFKWSPH